MLSKSNQKLLFVPSYFKVVWIYNGSRFEKKSFGVTKNNFYFLFVISLSIKEYKGSWSVAT